LRTYPSLIFTDSTRARLAALTRRQPRRVRVLTRELTRLATCPITECWIEGTWQEDLASRLLLARKLPGGDFAVVCCDLDLGCLGLREATISTRTAGEKLRQWRRELFAAPVDCFPSLGRKIFEHAVEFASSSGFEPSPEFVPAFAFFSTIDIRRQRAPVSCGVDGKPLLRPRAGDDLASLERKLAATVGKPPAYILQVPDA